MQNAHRSSGINLVIFIIFFFTGFHVALGQGEQKPVPKEVTYNPNGTVKSVRYGYQEYLPIGYDTQPTTKWPLIIHLVGLGERGNGSVQDLDTIAGIGIPKLIKKGRDYPFLVMSPQPTGKKGKRIQGDEGKYVPDTIAYFVNYILENYNVDPNRVYITAFSAAVKEAYRYIISNPEKVAAYVPVAGNGQFLDLCKMKDVPVWAFHNLYDSTITSDKSMRVKKDINSCNPPPLVPAKLTVYQKERHDAWTRTYDNTGIGQEMPEHDPFDETIYDWFLRYSKLKAIFADAGEDTTILAPANAVVLQGQSSPATGVTYQWSQVSGPNNATLGNANTSALTASNLVIGVYEFRLLVTDANNNKDEDLVKVYVRSLLANAGADTTVVLPVESVMLTGSVEDNGGGSGQTYTYTWAQLIGPNTAMLQNANTAEVTVSNLVKGTYELQLTIKDNEGNEAIDRATIFVEAPNDFLVANAGADTTVLFPVDSILLKGSGSDPYNNINSYQWTDISDVKATLTNDDSAVVTVTDVEQGIYRFVLTVGNDNEGFVSDTVVVTVSALTANAGKDTTVALSAESVQLVGTGYDPFNAITGFEWELIEGTGLTLTGIDQETLVVTDLQVGTFSFVFTVTNDMGATASDTVSLQVVGSSAPDAGVLSIVSPQQESFPYLSATPVTIEIKNHGAVDLADLEVGFQLNGQEAVVETLAEAVPAGGTSSYTFTTQADLSAYGNYLLEVFTRLPDDGNTSNDSLSVVLSWLDTISAPTYSESFEEGDGGWKVVGNNSSWQVGVPGGTIIDAASDGQQAWVTNLEGAYNVNDTSYLVSPIFDFSEATTDPVLTFDIWWEADPSDLLSISISTDGGATWTTLGALGDAQHWFTTATGWTGSGEEGSGQWITVSHPLDGAAGQSDVMIRFEFSSDSENTAEGFAIDNINVCQAAPSVASIEDITVSLTQLPLEIPLTISNADLANVTITAVSDNEEVIPNDSIEVVIAEGEAKLLVGALAKGSANLMVMVQQECASYVTFEVTVNEVTGIDDEKEPLTIIYPNPSDGVFLARWTDLVPKGATARVYTAQGALLQNLVLDAHEKEFTIDLRRMAQGRYVLVIQQGRTRQSFQLIKQ